MQKQKQKNLHDEKTEASDMSGTVNVKKKKATVEFIFDERKWDLDVITEDFVRRVLKKKRVLGTSDEGPEVNIKIEEYTEEDTEVSSKDER